MDSRSLRSALSSGMVVVCSTVALALNNGPARTPNMGFNPYSGPLGMITEQQFIMLGKAMVASGLKAAGYSYICNDITNNASVLGLSNPKTAVMDSLHAMGLKGGVYIMPTRDNATTQAGCTSWANKLATWECDIVKFDGWTGTPAAAFTFMRDALLATNRPILYNANIDEGPRDATICHAWRTSGDINIADWNSWTGNIGTNAAGTSAPGGWGDPDMMGIACGMPSETEEVAMFSLWCVTSSPLMTSTDFRVMFESTHYILLNTEAIAVNQDTAFSVNPSYGGSGRRIKQSGGQEIWLKTIAGGAKAVVLFNTGTAAAPITVNWTDIGLAAGEAQVRDLWAHRNLGPFTNSYTAQVPSHGVAFVKIIAGSTPIAEPTHTWFDKPADPVPVTPLPRTGWTLTLDLFVYGNLPDLLDGNLATGIACDVGNTTKSNLVIDMKTAQSFNTVILSNSTNKVGPNIKPYRVYQSVHLWELAVSDNGTTWSTIDSTWGGPMNYDLFTFSTQTARYIKISHSLVGCRLRNYNNAGDENMGGGYRGGGIAEVYVANANPTAAIISGSKPSSIRTLGLSPASPRLAVVAGGMQKVAVPGGTSLGAYSVDGKRMTPATDSRSKPSRSGVLIIGAK